MAKLNGYRIVNLTYSVKDKETENTTTNRILDQHFELDGLQSLMLLQNGGGKSVQIQMLIAPFVPPKDRNFGSRLFTDYFVDDRTPTYIATEWLLDNNDKVLIGLMVRKCKPSEVTSDNNGLDIYAYVYEYRNQSDDYSIKNIPFAQSTEDGYIISSTQETIELFEKIKKQNKFGMSYFNLGNKNKRAEYYKKLKTYDIDSYEWKTIMKTINSSEGGLTELFKNCPDESKLLEKWFIKTIDSKLNGDYDSIAEMKEVFKKYFKSKKKHQNAIDIEDGLNEYKQHAENILEVNSEHKEVLSEDEKNKDEIRSILEYNFVKNKSLEESQQKSILDEQALLRELAMTKYKEASYNYYKAEDLFEQAKIGYESIKEVHEELENKLKEYEKEINIDDVLKLINERKIKESELLELFERQEKANASNEEILAQLENVSYSLRNILDDEITDKYEVKDELEAEIDNYSTEKTMITKDLGRIEENNTSLKEEKTQLDDKLEVIKPKVDNYLKKYNAPLLVDGEFFGSLKDEKATEISDKGASIEKTNQEIETLVNKKEKLEENYKNIDRSEFETEIALGAKKKELEAANKECEKIREIIKYLDLDLDNVYDKEIILNELNKKLESVSSKIDLDNIKISKLEVKIEQLEKGIVVDLPSEVKMILKDLDIQYQLGLSYISKLNITLEQKEDLINANPLLPFSIVIDSKDIEILENNKVDLASSYSIFIANKDKISAPVKHKINNSILEIGESKLLHNFNKAIMDENEKKLMISILKQDLNEIKAIVENNKLNRISLSEKLVVVKGFSVTKSFVSNLELEISSLSEELSNIVKNKKNILDEINKIENIDIPKHKENLEVLKKELELLNSELEDINDFEVQYADLDEVTSKLERVKSTLLSNKETLVKHSNRLEELNGLIKVREKQVKEKDDEILDLDKILEEIRLLNFKFDNPVEVEESKEQLLARFKVLREDATKNIEEIKENIERVNSEIRIKNDEIDGLISIYNLISTDYENKEYVPGQKAFLTRTISKLKNDIKEKNELVIESASNVAKAESDKNTKLEKATKESDNTLKIYQKFNEPTDIQRGPISKSLIKIDMDFRKAKKEINELLEVAKNDILNIKNDLDIVRTSNNSLKVLLDINEDVIDIQEINTDITLDNLLDKTEQVISRHKQILGTLAKVQRRKDNYLSGLSTDFKYKDTEPYKSHIRGLNEFKDEPLTIECMINETLKSLEQLSLQNKKDLNDMYDVYQTTVNIVSKYLENVYNHLESIDTNSSIPLNGKRVKMLEIKQPVWDVVDIKSKIELFINKLIEGCEARERLGDNSIQSPEEFVATQITTGKLYDSTIGIKNIKISIKKLEFASEETYVSPISWKEAQKNSGGEGFATYFIILISLLSYMRKESSLIGDRTKESSKVLIMDNPFGKISSEHLLRPVMGIAKKYNTQLLCFTAQKGDNIYNEFDNIYHLNLENIRSLKTNILTAEREVNPNAVSSNDAVLQSAQLRMDTLIEV